MKRISRNKIIEVLETARQGFSSVCIVFHCDDKYLKSASEISARAHHRHLDRSIVSLGGESVDIDDLFKTEESMNNNSAAYLEKIEGMQSYENIEAMLGMGGLGKEVKNVVAKVKRLKAENIRLRNVVCIAINERFPKKAGVEFLQKHRITNQFGVMVVDT